MEPANPKLEGYPSFVLDESNADPSFVAVVKKIIRGIDFEDPDFCDSVTRDYFRRIRIEGARSVMRSILLRGKSSSDSAAVCRDLETHVGTWIIAKLTEDEKSEFLPHNDAKVTLRESELHIEFSSLESVYIRGRKYYCSRRKPTVEVGKSRGIVAFNLHLLQRICERVVPNWTEYIPLGDAHSFFADCVYFEPTYVRPRIPASMHDFTQPAIGLFQICHLEHWHPDVIYPQKEIWESIFFSGSGGSDDEFWCKLLTEPCYYRVGYCPVEFIDGFAVANTILLPGFKKTREYLAIQQSALDPKTKRRLTQTAISITARNDFSPELRELHVWLHNHAVLQVMPMNRVVFADEQVYSFLDAPYVVQTGLGEKLRAHMPVR